ncbi:hypothetical protein K3495_g14828, partial [Podosphaera aphanis]
MASNSISSTQLKDLNTFKAEQPETPFDPKNAEQATPKTTTDYILNAIDSYRELRWRDDNLWEVFRADFAEWVAEDFLMADKKAVRVLRDHLRENGLWVPKRQGLSIPLALQHVLEEETQHVWTKYDIDAQVNSGPLNSIHWRRNQAASPSKPAEVKNLSHEQSTSLQQPHEPQPKTPPPKLLPTEPAVVSTAEQIRLQLLPPHTVKYHSDNSEIHGTPTQTKRKLQLFTNSNDATQISLAEPTQGLNQSNKLKHIEPHFNLKGKKSLHANTEKLRFENKFSQIYYSPDGGEPSEVPYKSLSPFSENKYNSSGAGKFSKENNTIKNKNQFYRSQLNEEPSEYPHVQRNPSFYLSKQPTQQYESPNRVPTHELGTLSRIYRDEDRYGGSEDCLDLCL